MNLSHGSLVEVTGLSASAGSLIEASATVGAMESARGSGDGAGSGSVTSKNLALHQLEQAMVMEILGPQVLELALLLALVLLAMLPLPL